MEQKRRLRLKTPKQIVLPRKLYTLGPVGSYSEIAAKAYLKEIGSNAEIIGIEPTNKSEGVIEELVRHYENGEEDVIGFVPFYNTQNGRVRDTLSPGRGLLKYPIIQIFDEFILKVSHCLAAKKRSSIIRRVISHDQALQQCSDYLRSINVQMDNKVASTADAAKLVSQSENADMAAVCSEEAAEIYSLEVIEKNIQNKSDVYENRTIFVVIWNRDNTPTGRDKTTITFEFRDPNRPASMYEILKPFAISGINISHHEAMEKGSLTDYVFWFNVNEHRNNVKKEIAEMHQLTTRLTIHGSYPRKTP
jgi:prephenate dehydratase